MGYKITSTAQRPDMQPGQQTPGVIFRVWIRTEHGSTGYVDVSPADWKKEKLKPILEKFAEELDLAFTIAEE